MSECTIDGCERPAAARGWCKMHWARWRKNGDPLRVKKHHEYIAKGEAAGPFKHGLESHPLYHTWRNMINRCHNESNSSFCNYGARGITVCERWHDIRNFVKDMGDKPSKSSTLERVDNSLGYSPDNCRWAGRKAQARNRRTSKLTAADAEEIRRLRALKVPRKDLAERFRVSESTVKKIAAGTIWA